MWSAERLVAVAKSSGLDPAAVREYLDSDQDLDLIRGQDAHARQIGVTGVPCFIVADGYAVSGAQEPEVFLQVFAAAEHGGEEGEAETDEAAAADSR